MPKIYRTFALLFTLSIFPGCLDSDYPLSDPDKAVLMPELIGVWDLDPVDESSPWTVSAAGKGFPKGMHRVTGAEGGEDNGNYFFVTNLDNKRYANVVNFKNGSLPDKWDPEQITHFTLIGLSMQKDHVTLIEVSEIAAKAAAKNGELAFTVVKEQDEGFLESETEQLSSPTKELRECFAKRSNEIRGDAFRELKKRSSR